MGSDGPHVGIEQNVAWRNAAGACEPALRRPRHLLRPPMRRSQTRCAKLRAHAIHGGIDWKEAILQHCYGPAGFTAGRAAEPDGMYKRIRQRVKRRQDALLAKDAATTMAAIGHDEGPSTTANTASPQASRCGGLLQLRVHVHQSDCVGAVRSALCSAARCGACEGHYGTKKHGRGSHNVSKCL